MPTARPSTYEAPSVDVGRPVDAPSHLSSAASESRPARSDGDCAEIVARHRRLEVVRRARSADGSQHSRESESQRERPPTANPRCREPSFVNVVNVFVDEGGCARQPARHRRGHRRRRARREQQIAADLGFSETIFIDAVDDRCGDGADLHAAAGAAVRRPPDRRPRGVASRQRRRGQVDQRAGRKRARAVRRRPACS